MCVCVCVYVCVYSIIRLINYVSTSLVSSIAVYSFKD